MASILMGSVGRVCRTALFVLVNLFQVTTGTPILPEDTEDYTTLSVDGDFITANTTDTSPDDVPSGSDSMSIMWYLVSFAGLVTFFLLLSFSEFCCKKSAAALATSSSDPEAVDPPAPPPYELFAPPSYESLFRDIARDSKRSITVYLVPVHDKAETPRESPPEFGEVIRRNPMGDGEVVTPPPPP